MRRPEIYLPTGCSLQICRGTEKTAFSTLLDNRDYPVILFFSILAERAD
jgi:hypothetical protein